MLDPVQKHGTKPPLFLVHGVPGYMPFGPAAAEVLGPDRPVYAVHARGFDGNGEPLRSLADMAASYVGEIRRARPSGPYVIGGMCIGGLIALEIARELANSGERVGTVLLLDPFPVLTEWAGLVEGSAVDDPRIYRQLHNSLTHFFAALARRWPDTPLELGNPRALHNAIKVAITSMLAAHAYVPALYSGTTELVICGQRAASFFHPSSHWRALIEHPANVHVLPGGHLDLFDRHRATLCRLIGFSVEGAFGE